MDKMAERVAEGMRTWDEQSPWERVDAPEWMLDKVWRWGLAEEDLRPDPQSGETWQLMGIYRAKTVGSGGVRKWKAEFRHRSWYGVRENHSMYWEAQDERVDHWANIWIEVHKQRLR